MMTIQYRLLCYVGLDVIATIGLIANAFHQSALAYAAGDKSAYAWTAFLPYLIPIFFVQSLVYVIPFSIFLEILLFIMRYRKTTIDDTRNKSGK